MVPTRLLSLRTGRTRNWSPTVRTAIRKSPVVDVVRLGMLGLEGDEQADTLHHGGIDKAVHHYPAQHYTAWTLELPEHASQLVVGAFGENFSTLGMDEHSVCIGDVYRVGTALLQVSSGRRPCSKLNWATGVDDMVQRVAATRRTGWYYRVIEAGEISGHDALHLVSRSREDWPVFRVVGAVLGVAENEADYEQLADMPELYAGWRTVARSRLSQR